MVGDIQAHCRCHLEFLRPGGVHVGQLLRPGGIGLTHAAVGSAGGCGGIRTLGILCPQGIAGQGGVGRGLTAVGILIQRRIGVLLGLVLRLAAGVRAKVVSCHQLVGRGFGTFHTLCHLIEIAVHVRTHGGSQCFAVVLVECECTNIHIPGTLNLAQHGVFHPSVHNIDGCAGTYCRRSSGCKSTGLGSGGAGPGGGNMDVYKVLCSIHADLNIVVTSGGDSGVLADVAADHIIRDVQGHGGIQSHIFRGMLLFALGGGCQGVRSCHTGGLGIPDGICPHIQRPGLENPVVTDPCHHFHGGAGHGEACAHAHGLSGGVCHRRGLYRVRGACRPECDLNVGVSVRHIEQVSRTALSIHNGQVFHGNGSFFRSRHKFQGIQNEAVLCLDDDCQTFPCRPIERCLVCNGAKRAVHFHQLDLALEGGATLNRIAVGVLAIDFLCGKVIRNVGVIDRDLAAAHKVGPQFHRRLGGNIQLMRNTCQVLVQNHVDGMGGFPILGGCHILEDQSVTAVLVIKVNLVILIMEGQGLRCPAGIPIGQAQAVLGLVTRVRSNGDQVAFHLGRYAVIRGLGGSVLIDREFHLAVFPGVGFEYALAGSGSLPGAGTGGGIGVVGTGTHVGIGLALAVFRRSGNGLFILVAQSTNDGILCHRKNLGVVFPAGCHNGRCLSLEDGQGHASCHGNFLGTGAGDGLGGEAVSRLPGRCLEFYIQQFGKGIQCRIGQCLSCGTEGRLHLFLDHRTVHTLDKGHELIHIAQSPGQFLAQVSGQIAKVFCHNGVKFGIFQPRNILGQYRAVNTGNGLQAAVDDFRQLLHHQVSSTKQNTVFPHQCRFDGLGESLGGQAAGIFISKNIFQQRLGHVHNAAFQNARNGLPTLGLQVVHQLAPDVLPGLGGGIGLYIPAHQVVDQLFEGIGNGHKLGHETGQVFFQRIIGVVLGQLFQAGAVQKGFQGGIHDLTGNGADLLRGQQVRKAQCLYNFFNLFRNGLADQFFQPSGLIFVHSLLGRLFLLLRDTGIDFQVGSLDFRIPQEGFVGILYDIQRNRHAYANAALRSRTVGPEFAGVLCQTLHRQMTGFPVLGDGFNGQVIGDFRRSMNALNIQDERRCYLNAALCGCRTGAAGGGGSQSGGSGIGSAYRAGKPLGTGKCIGCLSV